MPEVQKAAPWRAPHVTGTLDEFYSQVAERGDNYWKDLAALKEPLKILRLNRVLKNYPDFDPGKLARALNIVREKKNVRKQNERYYGNPLDTAFDLIANRRPFDTIIAGLIAGSITPLNSKPEHYTNALRKVEKDFGGRILKIVDDSARLAFDHRPVPSEDLAARMAADEKRFGERMTQERERKHLHDTAAHEQARKAAARGDKKYQPKLYVIDKSAIPRHRQRWIRNYSGMIKSKNYMPEAHDVRISERTVLLRTIDPKNPTPQQKTALEESYEVHSLMALRRNLWGFTEWVGDLYVKTFHPEAHDAIGSFKSNLLEAFAELNDPVVAAQCKVIERLKSFGLIQVDDVAKLGHGGDFYFSQRPKSIFSIWRKLRDDGIDPLEYIKDIAKKTGTGPIPRRATILYEKVLKDNIFDLFGWRLVVDTHALLKKGLIEEYAEKDLPARNGGREKTQDERDREALKNWRRTERNATYFLRDVIDAFCAETDPASPAAALTAEPERDRNYIEKPKPITDYRSFHKGLAVTISIPALELANVKIPIEAQLRTREMHEKAENGDSAWLTFRERGNADNYPAAWRAANGEVTHEDVYAVTPQGDIIHVGKNATVYDFAARLGPEMALGCRRAVVYSGYPTSHPLDAFRGDLTRELEPEDRLPNGVMVRLVKHDWATKPDLATLKTFVTKPLLDRIDKVVVTNYGIQTVNRFRRKFDRSREAALSSLRF